MKVLVYVSSYLGVRRRFIGSGVFDTGTLAKMFCSRTPLTVRCMRAIESITSNNASAPATA